MPTRTGPALGAPRRSALGTSGTEIGPARSAARTRASARAAHRRTAPRSGHSCARRSPLVSPQPEPPHDPQRLEADAFGHLRLALRPVHEDDGDLAGA